MSAAERGATAEWRKCPNCGAYVYHKRLKRQLGVCPECNHHFRIALRERLGQLLDPDSFEELGPELEPLDSLGFVDSKPYPERIAKAQRGGARSGAVWGRAKIDGHPLILAGIDFSFIGGSLGSAEGEAITLAAELALAERTPLLVISASGGARMQEGAVSLMQMVKTSQALARLREEGVLYVSLLTDPTYGGVSASFATLGDVLIAEPGAHIGFAGPSVIEQTIGQKLPEGFQTSEFLFEHGMVDLVEPRENLRAVLRRLLTLHAAAEAAREGDRTALLPETEGADPVIDADSLPVRDPWDVVQLARMPVRPHMLDYTGLVFDDFQELHGDRLFAEDAAIVGGLARLGDLTVMAIGHQKGRTTAEMMERNFGMPNPEGYRKALRLMHYAVQASGCRSSPSSTRRAPSRAWRPRSAGSRWRSPRRSWRCRACPSRSSPRSPARAARAARSRWPRRRPRDDPRGLLLLGDQPRGLRDDPLQGLARRAPRRRRVADERAEPAAARHRRRVVLEPEEGAHPTS